jgi:hypothetical protein
MEEKMKPIDRRHHHRHHHSEMKSESSRATAFPDGFDECGPSVGQTAPFKIQLLVEISCCHDSASFLTSQANVT